MNKYIGHKTQFYGVELHRLEGGKGDGMRLLEINNGLGLQLVISLDRCADISRLLFKGINYGYMSPVGYVHPSYYNQDKFLSSFTAGFLTTCGLNNVGSPNEDNGETLPLHGTISNHPVESYNFETKEKEIIITARIVDEEIFSHKLVLSRKYTISLTKNRFTIEDTISNEGSNEYPLEILYHMNMGYPLLSENAELYINSSSIKARNEYALNDIDNWMNISAPINGIDEKCYFHNFEDKNAYAALFNKDLGTGVQISFNSDNLKYFTEWKMMGVRDYVLGLEPGNCHPDGRNKMRQEGTLKILKPSEKVTYKVEVNMIESLRKFNSIKNK